MKSLWLAATILFGGLLAPVFIHAQSNERTVNLYHWRNEPLKILSIKVKDKEIKPNEKFVDEDDDWFRDLAVEVENVSDKTIVYIDIHLAFPDTPEITNHPAGADIWYGSHQWFRTGKKVVNRALPPIKPGEKATVKLTDYQGVRRLLNAVGYGKSLKEFRIDISSALFDNDILWESGQIMVRDANNKERWTKRSRLPN
jgi:hypothetical protein